jgi:hypothetical protein
MSIQLPDKYRRWVFDARGEMVRRMASGEEIPPDKLFLGFTRHCPTFISNGPAGLSGSVKGVGFIPTSADLPRILAAYRTHIDAGWRAGYSQEGLRILAREMWAEGQSDHIDFELLGSLELAKKHSWDNFRANPEICLTFFQPPMVTYEVRGVVEIHESGPYHEFLNAQHDVYHQPHPERWADRPAYVIRIREIYDNSATKEGFGTRLL